MFLIISRQIIKMFLLMMVAFITFRAKVIDHEGSRTISNLVLMVVTPMLILKAFLQEATPQLVRGLGLALLLAFLTHFGAILISRIFFPAGKSPNYTIEQFSVVYSNCGFIGIPLISGVFGDEGIFYITAYVAVFSILIWTHGLLLMNTPGTAETNNTKNPDDPAAKKALEQRRRENLRQIRKGLTSPVMFSIVIGIIIFLSGIRLPDVVTDTVSYIGDMNTPLGMFVAGATLAEADLLKTLKNRQLYKTAAVKLFVIPLAVLAVFAFLPLNKTVLYAILIANACPTGSTGIMFALRYDKNYKYASEIFTFSTLVSMVTIPLVILLAERVIL